MEARTSIADWDGCVDGNCREFRGYVSWIFVYQNGLP